MLTCLLRTPSAGPQGGHTLGWGRRGRSYGEWWFWPMAC